MLAPLCVRTLGACADRNAESAVSDMYVVYDESRVSLETQVSMPHEKTRESNKHC